MKKILSILVFIFVVLQIDAQLQRKFFGHSFGSSKQSVVQTMKSKGYQVDNYSNKIYVTNPKLKTINFGGLDWECIVFEFFQNKLMSVTFCVTTDTYTPSVIVDKYNETEERLINKYQDYIDNRPLAKSGAKCIDFSDDKTQLIFRYIHIDSNGDASLTPTKRINLYLWYIDREIMVQQHESENSEL
jgi:hypothetical protein